MGLFGDEPRIRNFEGIPCQMIEDRFTSRAEAELWKAEAERDGMIAHVISNPAKECFELWVSTLPKSQLPGQGSPSNPAKKQD